MAGDRRVDVMGVQPLHRLGRAGDGRRRLAELDGQRLDDLDLGQGEAGQHGRQLGEGVGPGLHPHALAALAGEVQLELVLLGDDLLGHRQARVVGLAPGSRRSRPGRRHSPCASGIRAARASLHDVGRVGRHGSRGVRVSRVPARTSRQASNGRRTRTPPASTGPAGRDGSRPRPRSAPSASRSASRDLGRLGRGVDRDDDGARRPSPAGRRGPSGGRSASSVRSPAWRLGQHEPSGDQPAIAGQDRVRVRQLGADVAARGVVAEAAATGRRS